MKLVHIRPLVMALFFMLSSFSHAAASPYVVEIFMKQQSCGDVLNMEDSLEYMNASLQSDPEAIIIRCQIPHEASQQERARWVCNNRLGNYKNSLPRTPLGRPPIREFGVVLNGRYIDHAKESSKLLDAVAMVRSLKEVKTVELNYKDQFLEISFPELKFNKKPFAQIIALNPGEDITYVDFINGGERTIKPRNVATNGRIIRNWDGTAMSLSVPVDDMPAEKYVVLVNSTEGGHVIAAGQVQVVQQSTP